MTKTETPKRPTHTVYAVIKRGDSDKGFWTRIGVAFANSDGLGFSLKLDLMPVNGADIVMREPKDATDEGDAQ